MTEPWAALAQALADLLAAGWQLVAFSMLFAVVAWFVSLLLGRRAPALQFALWSLVFIRLVIPPGIGHSFGFAGIVQHLWSSPRPSSGQAEVLGESIGGVGFMQGAVTGPILPAESASGFGVLLGVVFLWSLGASLCLFHQALRRRPYLASLRRSIPVHDTQLLAVMNRWRRLLGVERHVELLWVEDRVSPFTVGVVKPVICLPRLLASDASARTLETCIAHEMAHVKRYDSLWLRLRQVIQAVFFFNPAVWVAGTRMHEGAERLCDAMVIAVGDVTARRYAGDLLDVLQFDLRRVEAPTLSAAKRRMSVRIQSILDRRGRGRPRTVVAAFAAVAIGVMLAPAGDAVATAEQQSGLVPASAPEVSEIAAPEFVNPLPNARLTWGYGKGIDPFKKVEVFHRGVDLAAKEGTPIVAPAAATVTVATTDFKPIPAAGTVVELDHGNGWVTRYHHLGELEVEAGQRVAAGDVIAGVGNTGKSTGPHLHLEVWHNGDHVDSRSVMPGIGD